MRVSARHLVPPILFLALSPGALALDPPAELTIRAFAKPAGERFHLLLRVPLKSFNGINFPSRGTQGELDLAAVEGMLPSASRWWIADNIEVYEGTLLLKPQVVEVRVSLPSDASFASYEEAFAHMTGPALPGGTQVFRDQAMLDVLLDYTIRSDRSSFAIHSSLSRLAARVSTELRFLPSNGPARTFEYQGDPDLFSFDPLWSQVVRSFVSQGFFHILKGTDYLLFLFCAALLLRGYFALVPFASAFTIAYSVTMIASAYNLASDALWFPVLIETAIAASIVSLAFANIACSVGASRVVHRKWWPLAFGIGLVYGFGFAFALRPTLQFAGSHVLASVLSFNLGLEMGLVIVLALLVPVLDALLRFTAKRQVEAIILSALAADLGWHRFTDRAERLSQFSFRWPVLDADFLANSMRWLTIFLVLAGSGCLVYALRRSRAAPEEKPGAGEETTAALPGAERPRAL